MIVGEASEPAERLAGVRYPRVPVAHRREVRQARMVVAAPVHDSHPAVFVETLEADHRRMEPERVAHLQNVFRRDANAGASAVIGGIAVWHDGVEAVVAPGELEHDEDSLGMLLHARALERLRSERGGRATQKHRQARADTDAVQTAHEKFATRT